MEPFRTYICEEDVDFRRCMTFILQTKRTADPGLRTADAYAAMLRVLTYGTLIRFEDEQGLVIGIVGYTLGSPQQEYEDRETAYVEYCLMPLSRQGSLFFIQGLGILVRTIQDRHPEIVHLSLAAAENHRRNNRLYAKFAKLTGRDMNDVLNMNLYTASLDDVRQYVERFH
ncbi:hypothetical protein DUZ99_02695 [Xylanibacillus composti]|uniref:Uncharacterized protein n=1 Tax=Xylanibacillus composti TaxID=1572762 RepID=A0A8J4GYX5_9BACL|nr:hypothetical protein [Xylanibacillus composti]MDT9723905.1 hypothetical protein [Xylanibacillus composti]GIQ67783.1 hypothetical protein XYCOK13_06070 [Xylanibacillus composti]